VEAAGWLLIISGIVWVFLKTASEIWAARKAAAPQSGNGREAVRLPSVDDIAKLLAAPYGVGMAMIIIGAVLLMTDAGFTVTFEGSTPQSPSPRPTP
jgi:hypothetical protein